MTFGESVRYCLAHRNDYTGRARRSEFWWFCLANSLAGLAVSAILYVIMFGATFATAFGFSEGKSGLGAGGVIALVVSFLLLFAFAGVQVWLMLAAQARRLHDVGYTAQLLWLYAVGLGIVPLVLCIMEGQPYTNQWGPDPKADERAAYGFPPPPPPVA